MWNVWVFNVSNWFKFLKYSPNKTDLEPMFRLWADVLQPLLTVSTYKYLNKFCWFLCKDNQSLTVFESFKRKKYHGHLWRINTVSNGNKGCLYKLTLLQNICRRLWVFWKENKVWGCTEIVRFEGSGPCHRTRSPIQSFENSSALYVSNLVHFICINLSSQSNYDL